MNSGREEQEEVSLRFCGSGGMGVILSSIILGKATLYDNKNAIQTQSYGPEQRGTRVKSDLIINEGELLSYPTETDVDILVAYSSDAFNFYSNHVKLNGLIFINSDLIRIEKSSNNIHKIPATTIGKDLGNEKTLNIIMLGALIKKTNIVTINAVNKTISETLPMHYIDINLDALKRGYSFFA